MEPNHLPMAVCEICILPYPRQNVLAQVSGADDGLGFVSQVVGVPHESDAVVREHPLVQVEIQLPPLLSCGPDQLWILVEERAEVLESEERPDQPRVEYAPDR